VLHFYGRLCTDTSPASLIDHLSFLLFPNAPPSLSIPHSTLPSSVSSPVVLDYTVKPPVTQFYNRRGVRLLNTPASSNELSSDMPSSSFVGMCHLLLLLSPPLRLIPLLSGLLDIVTAFVAPLTITLLLLL
jgi:hypothetical protein